MRIGIYAPYIGRLIKTGVEVYAEEIVKRMVKDSRHEFLLIGAKQRIFENVGYVDIQSRGKIVPLLGELQKIRKKEKLDSLFFPSQYTYFSNIQPTVTTIHDVAWKYYPEYFPLSRRVTFDFLTNYAVKHAGRIVAVSEATKKDLITYYRCYPEKIYVIGEGFDSNKYHSKYSELDEKLLTLRGLKFGEYLLFLGTLQKRKNIVNLVKAYDRSECSLPLVLAGNKGWFYEEIEEAIRSCKKRDLIIQLGYIREEEKAALYRGCTMFLYPSLYEGFGLPVLEAMACGCLVLTSNVSSLPEVIGDAGFVVDPLDIDAMAEAINLGINGPHSELRNAAISRASLFTWERAASITLSVLKEVF